MATSESTWNMWFWTMSRMAPISSYSLPRPSTPIELGDGDLHPCDGVAIPYPFEERVPETEDEKVLNRLLPHVVVDTEDALLGNDVVKRPVERLGRLQVVTERFLDDDRRAIDQSGRLDAFDQRRECRGRNREICDAPIQRARRSERREIPVRRKWDEVQALCERREHVLLQRRPRELLDRGFSEVAKALIVPCERGGADDLALLRQQLLAMQVVEGGNQLALRKVTGCANDDDVLVGWSLERHRRSSGCRYRPVK